MEWVAGGAGGIVGRQVGCVGKCAPVCSLGEINVGVETHGQAGV